MRISPINTNIYTKRTNTLNNTKQTTPAFKGEQSNALYKATLDKLKKVNSEIIVGFNPDKLNSCISEMVEKYSCLGTKSVGIQVIGKEDLADFLGDKAKPYNTKDKFGLCVAVGDKFGPVEKMNRIYEAKTFIVSEYELNNLQ